LLEGKTIAITRSKEESEEFIELLTNDKATPISLPTIELVSKGEKIVEDFLNLIKQHDPDYSIFLKDRPLYRL